MHNENENEKERFDDVFVIVIVYIRTGAKPPRLARIGPLCNLRSRYYHCGHT
jgi:hypothetical protein